MEKEEKKDNKNSKRGLIIVIIVLLLALLGAGLFHINNNTDNDTQLIRNLNIAVSNDLKESGIDKHPTMYDAVQACIKAGYITDRIVAVSGYNIAWESTTGHFVLVDMEKDMVMYPVSKTEIKEYSCANNRLDYFVVTKASQYKKGIFIEKYSLYSIYAYGSGWPSELSITKGFDAGDVKVFTKIAYKNDNKQNVIIRTNTFATTLTIDAPKDTVKHYGYAAIINVLKIASSSLDEYGVVGRIENQEGHVEVMDGAEVFCLMENGENVEPTTINDGGIVHENMVNINAEEGIEKDSTTGIANGHVDDCGPGRHTFSEYVIDTEHVYDVCTCCGYTLVHVKDTKGTVIKQSKNTLNEAGNVTGDDVVTPVKLYATSEKIAVKSNGEVNVESLKKQNFTIGEEPIGEVDPDKQEEPVKEACQHNWVYTPNNDGTHKVKCSKCSSSYNENCNTNGNEGACSKCGYIAVNYLTFTANQANSTVTFNPYSGTSQYSVDGGKTWHSGNNVKVTLSKVGDKVYYRGDKCTTRIWGGYYPENEDDVNEKNVKNFKLTGKLTVSGDLTCLTNGTGNVQKLTLRCYEGMFYGNDALISAENLLLPTLDLSIADETITDESDYCYNAMFFNCYNLTKAPKLPATKLIYGCYIQMFRACISLTEAPALPAKEIDSYCYHWMFYNCSALVKAPALPATKLYNSCYERMFLNCKEIEVAPALPAENLANRCYYGMFIQCKKLIKTPDLPATVLKESCYEAMFNYCTSLKEIGVFNATTLASNSCTDMFTHCHSLHITTDSSKANAKAFFTCPNNPGAMVISMFAFTADNNANNSPSANTTYYWYPCD